MCKYPPIANVGRHTRPNKKFQEIINYVVDVIASLAIYKVIVMYVLVPNDFASAVKIPN